MFRINDVKHLLQPRFTFANDKVLINYQNIKDDDSLITINKSNIQKVIVALESERMHYFLCDKNKYICRCLWDGDVTYDEKVEIVNSMIEWFSKVRYNINYNLYDYDDIAVFSYVKDIHEK